MKVVGAGPISLLLAVRSPELCGSKSALSHYFTHTDFQLVGSDVLPDSNMSKEEQKAQCIVEKKTAINLVEAFAIFMKHYLHGEDGIYYE